MIQHRDLGAQNEASKSFQADGFVIHILKMKSKGVFGDTGFKDNGTWNEVQENIRGQGFKSWDPLFEGHD